MRIFINQQHCLIYNQYNRVNIQTVKLALIYSSKRQLIAIIILQRINAERAWLRAIRRIEPSCSVETAGRALNDETLLAQQLEHRWRYEVDAFGWVLVTAGDRRERGLLLLGRILGDARDLHLVFVEEAGLVRQTAINHSAEATATPYLILVLGKK